MSFLPQVKEKHQCRKKHFPVWENLNYFENWKSTEVVGFSQLVFILILKHGSPWRTYHNRDQCFKIMYQHVEILWLNNVRHYLWGSSPCNMSFLWFLWCLCTNVGQCVYMKSQGRHLSSRLQGFLQQQQAESGNQVVCILLGTKLNVHWGRSTLIAHFNSRF